MNPHLLGYGFLRGPRTARSAEVTGLDPKGFRGLKNPLDDLLDGPNRTK